MKKWIVSGIVIGLIVVSVLVFFLLRGEKEGAEGQKTAVQQDKEALPLDVSLRFIPGGEGEGGLLKIRVFSRRLLQQEIDNRIIHKGQEREIRPIAVQPPEGFWNENVRFIVVSADETARAAGGKDTSLRARLVFAPEDEEWTFTPGKVYEALYVIDAADAPSPGTRVLAELAIEGRTIRSNDFTVPPFPEDDRERLLQKAEFLLNLGRIDALMETAEKLIAAFPDDPAGYWFKGLSLEGSGDRSGALAAYEEALKKFPHSGREGSVEPPMRLIRRIRELRAKPAEKEASSPVH
ncbi:MAG: tetratricopeptide repeat protein [Candidatus Aminicenantales bacterium]